MIRFLSLKQYFARSVTRQLVLAGMVVQSVLIALLIWQLTVREGAALEEQRVVRAKGIAAMLATSGAPSMLSEDSAALEDLVSSSSSLAALRYAMFTDQSGRVFAHTDPRRNGSYLTDPTSRSLTTRSPGPRVLAHTSDIVDVAAPVRMGSATIGWARVGLSLADIAEGQRTLALNAVGFGAFALLVGLAISLMTARRVTSRLEDLADVTDLFRRGSRNVRVLARGSDEVANAGRGVNAMLDTIAESERSLKEVQRIAKVGSWSYDPREPALVWSEEVYELFGLDASGPPPTFEQFLATLPDAQKSMILDLVSASNPTQVSSFTLNIARPDGGHRFCWAEAQIRERLEDGRPVLVGICQDITERENAAAQLRQAQKMEAVGQLTGGLAHDFNNLLAVIIGNLDFLQEEMPGGSVSEPLGDAMAAALRGAELTRQLLAFSRRQPLNAKSIDLNQLISGMKALWRRTLGESVEVRIKLADDLWLTEADSSQVESAVLNLVINARDAMPTGGILTVETRNASIEAQADNVAADMEPGDYSVITVSDTGSGMSSETAAQAFEPFFTTKAVGAGSGLGLSMIYGFAKQSRGHVRIYSEMGLGTAVSIYLPRTVENCDASSAEQIDISSAAAKGETVLLVEDDENVRRVTARQLEELAYEVLTASTGLDALAVLEGNPHVHLLVTDIVMPGGMNGVELSERAIDRYPHLRVLHMSGFTQIGMQGRHELRGISNLITKPFRKADLAAKLRELLDAPHVCAE